MSENTAFWKAFLKGLSGPVSLYDRPTPYSAYVNLYTVPQTFAVVGSTVSLVTGMGYAGKPQSTAPTATRISGTFAGTGGFAAEASSVAGSGTVRTESARATAAQ